MARTFQCSVVTPERAVLETEATSVIFPAWDGEVGIMAGRAPLLARMGIGLLRVKTAAGATERLYVDGGFAQMVDDKLTILTEQARDPGTLEAGEARRILGEAQEMKITDRRTYQLRQAALERGRVQRRLASGGGS